MKKILSLFVTIALLMVQFTGCQNMADPQIDPFEHPEEEPKHTITLPKANAGDVTGDGSMELERTTGEEVSIYLFEEKGDHKFIGIAFVDANNPRVVLDVPYTLDYDKGFKVCFTMPDADIILYRIIIESVLVKEKDIRANYSLKMYDEYSKKGRFKFTYLCWGKKIEITDWIDNSGLCEPEAGVEEGNCTYTYYFSVTFKCPDLTLRFLQEDEDYPYTLRKYPENTK